MTQITVTPAQISVGDAIDISGDGFADGGTVTVDIPRLGIRSEIVADASGAFGTDDVADHATTTLTSDGTNVTAADTVTIGAVTYTFRAAPTTVANEVKIGADAATTLGNLKKAINLTGVSGTDYGSGTVIHPTVTAGDITATTLKLHAKTGGTGGNSLTSTEASTHLSFPGATFNSGTPGTAATGISPLVYSPIAPGTYDVTATDGTNTATTTFQVWTR